MINRKLVKEFLEDQNLKSNLVEVLKQFSSSAEDNTTFLLTTILVISTSRFNSLREESQRRLNAIEECICYMSHDNRSPKDFYYLVGAFKEMYPNYEFDFASDRNSLAVRKVFEQFLSYFKLVNHEIDDKWLEYRGLKNWIYKLKDYVNTRSVKTA